MSIARQCALDKCERKLYAKGYCNLHWQRFRKYGEPSLDKSRNHGMNNHYVYSIWEGIKQRCYNPKQVSFHRYGGRGITLFDEWHNFKPFAKYILEQLGDRPEGYTLDRIDNSKGYEPDNIRWATKKQQSANRDLSVNNKHGYQGLSYDKFRNKWLVRMQLGDKYKYIGRYDTQEEALSAILHIESIRHL